MRKFARSQNIALMSLFAAMYTVVTVFAPIPQYQAIQFRFGEALNFLPFFFGPIGVIGLSLGCLVANIFSPYGLLDMALGTLSTVLASLAVMAIGMTTKLVHFKRNIFIATVVASLIISVIIAFLLTIYAVPFEFGFFTVLLGELTMTVVVGYPLALGMRRIWPAMFSVEE